MPFVLPPLYAKQRAAVCDPRRVVCIESTTKAGKTMGCAIWQIGQVMSGPPDAEHWWVAPVYEQSMMAYRLAWSLLRGQPGFRQVLSERAIIGPGERRWSFRSADKPDNLYGSAVSSAVLDEASRMKDDAVDAVYSTTTTLDPQITAAIEASQQTADDDMQEPPPVPEVEPPEVA